MLELKLGKNINYEFEQERCSVVKIIVTGSQTTLEAFVSPEHHNQSKFS